MWCGALTLLAVSLAACSDGERPGIAPRNVVLVSIAGLRADHCSLDLYPRRTTHIEIEGGQAAIGRSLGLDEMAADGVVFARAFAPGVHPRANMAALLTGRAPQSNQVVGQGADLALDSAGVGPWNVAVGLSELGFECTAFVSSREPLGPAWERGFSHFERGGDDIDVLGKAVTWASERDHGSGGRSFLWLHLEGPRHPFAPGTFPDAHGQVVDFSSLFADPGYQGPARDPNLATTVELDIADRRHIIDRYDGEVACVTALLYRFLDFARYAGDTSGAWQSTLFILVGAGGLELPHLVEDPRLGSNLGVPVPGREDTLREEALRVPLFLRLPDSLTGRRIFDNVVEVTDVAPTVMDWFRGSVPADLDGRSLLARADRRPVRTLAPRGVVSVAPQGVSLRTSRHRLTRLRSEGSSRVLLHDIVRDPLQLEDLSGTEPELMADLTARLEAELARLGAGGHAAPSEDGE